MYEHLEMLFGMHFSLNHMFWLTTYWNTAFKSNKIFFAISLPWHDINKLLIINSLLLFNSLTVGIFRKLSWLILTTVIFYFPFFFHLCCLHLLCKKKCTYWTDCLFVKNISIVWKFDRRNIIYWMKRNKTTLSNVLKDGVNALSSSRVFIQDNSFNK